MEFGWHTIFKLEREGGGGGDVEQVKCPSGPSTCQKSKDDDGRMRQRTPRVTPLHCYGGNSLPELVAAWQLCPHSEEGGPNSGQSGSCQGWGQQCGKQQQQLDPTYNPVRKLSRTSFFGVK